MLLLNAVKDVAISMGTLLEATKNASGKSRTDGQMLKLKVSCSYSSSDGSILEFRSFQKFRSILKFGSISEIWFHFRNLVPFQKFGSMIRNLVPDQKFGSSLEFGSSSYMLFPRMRLRAWSPV